MLNKTVLLPAGDLYEEPLNPRAINDEDLDNLILKIEQRPDHLVSRPILAYKKGKRYFVYSGSQRVKALKKMWAEEIPVRIDTEITEGWKVNIELLKARMLKANEEEAETDMEMIANIAPVAAIIHMNIPQVSAYIESIHNPIIDATNGADRHEVISENDDGDSGGIVGVTLEYDESDYVKFVAKYESEQSEDETMSEFVLRKLRSIWA